MAAGIAVAAISYIALMWAVERWSAAVLLLIPLAIVLFA